MHFVWLLLSFTLVYARHLQMKCMSEKALSQMNYSSSTLVAKSGEIYDTNMTPIAVSNRVYILIIDPKVIMEQRQLMGERERLKQTVKAIAQCFDLERSCAYRYNYPVSR